MPTTIPSSTGDTKVLDQAKSWLDDCDRNHPACQPPASDIRPARLIFIGDNNTLRLASSPQFPEHLKYATLSHCWGTIEYLKLQDDNLEEFSRCIPTSRLSKTFTESIIIAKQLGIRYLWIDSLCIVQNDNEDWSRESKKMSSIYGCSTINIAASGARDGSMGCFFDRGTELQASLRKACIPVRALEEKVAMWAFDCIRDSLCQVDIEDAPLASRGWCFQERFLPHRTLHFGKSQVWWKCETRAACETFPDELPNALGLPTLKTKATEQFEKNGAHGIALGMRIVNSISVEENTGRLDAFEAGRFRDKSILGSAGSLAKAWAKAVEMYSDTKLTRQSDKFVAMAGVADWFSARNGDEYVAGMWRKHLEVQLLWFAHASPEDQYHDAQSSSEYLAPTWSWASTRRRIDYKAAFDIQTHGDDDQKWTQNIHVLDVTIRLAYPSFPHGPLVGGTLRLAFSRILSGTADWCHPPHMKQIVHWDLPAKQDGLLYYLPVYACCDRMDSDLCFTEGLVLKAKLLEQGIFQRVGHWLNGGCMVDNLREVDMSGFKQEDAFSEGGKIWYELTLV